jgi:hypothetical protein
MVGGGDNNSNRNPELNGTNHVPCGEKVHIVGTQQDGDACLLRTRSANAVV